MPDWIGADGTSTAERYRRMAVEVRGVSPSYEVLCLGVVGDAELLTRLDTLPVPKRQPNLLLAAVRHLDGPVAAWPAFRSFVLDRWADVAATMLARRTQTNEPARCATLLPVLAQLPQPLALLEVGASAGLCLIPDRYAYRYTSAAGDHRVGAGRPELHCAVSGPTPLPARLPEVVWRCGLDLHPLDLRSDEDMRWLESLIWPEETDRFGALHAAVGIARADPPPVVAGDLITDLVDVAVDAPDDATLVVFHTAVLAYVDDEGRAAFVEQIRELGRRRPTHWLSNEAPGIVAGTADAEDGSARFVLARDGRPIARTAPHGSSIEWLAAGPDG